ncbi:hypothetical protein PAMP_017134 [Pampus punctatissimus]
MAASLDEDFESNNQDYYSLLNVRKEATLEELKASYRRLCMLYHPDKHRDPELKSQAEQLFNQVHQAYEVLSDAHSRAIYDIFGKKGLEVEGWEGTISVGVDATDLFDRYDEDFEEMPGGGFPHIEINKMHISQSIEAPLTNSDTAVLSGSLSTHNGNGGGNINMTVRRVTSAKGWGEFSPRGLRPSCSLMTARHLDQNTMGYLQWRWGPNSSMTTSVVRDTKRSHFTLALQLGVPHSYLMMSYQYKFQDEDQTKVKGSVKTGWFGTVVEYGAERKISRHSVLSATVSIGVPQGVTLKIKGFFDAFAVIIESLHGESQWAIVDVCFVCLCASQRFRIAEEELSHRHRQEEAGGRVCCLIILNAWYGKFVSDTSQKQEKAKVIDVTVPLQCLVKDSKLILTEASKAGLPGFYDPCVGEEKSLKLLYQFRGVMHQVISADNEPLRIPKQC